jgi:hypothetical protein
MRQITIHPIDGEELMAYLDGELSDQRALLVQAHVETCPDCKKLAADFQSVSSQLREWSVEDTTPGIKLPIAEPERRRPGKFFSTRSAWVLAPIGVAVLMLLLLRPQQLPQRAVYRPNYGARQQFSGTIGGSEGLSSELDAPMMQRNAVPAPAPPARAVAPPASSGPMIVRTADLRLTTRRFEQSRDAVQGIVQQHSGYVAELSINAAANEAKSLHSTLRVPAAQLESALVSLRTLGRVTYESEHGEDVTKQFVDLNARLDNARHTEQRLTELLRDRTGKLSDVLAVEEQIDNVRGQIESMEAEVKNMASQVAFSSIDVTISEEYNVPLSETGTPSITTQLRNAAAEGYHNLVGVAVGLLAFVLSIGPALLIILAILYYPARLIWRKTRSN